MPDGPAETMTDRHHIEALQLRLLESSTDLLAICDDRGCFVWASPSWTEALGWSVDELVGTPFLEFVFAGDKDRTLAKFEEMLAESRAALQFQNRYRHRDGGTRWLEWNAKVGDDGMTLCVARDITARKETELREHERVRQLELAEELVGIGHWRVDLRTMSPKWSKRVYEIHGRSLDFQPSIEAAIAAYHPDDRERVAHFVAQAISDRREFEFEARIVRPTGEVRWVQSYGVPEVDGDGEVLTLFGVFRDITDERQLDESMRRSERMASIGTMAAGIAHEINNPLSYLMGNLQLIEEHLRRDRDRLPTELVTGLQDMITDSYGGADRVRKIVHGLRSFSRGDTAEPRATRIAGAVRSAVAIADHQIRMRAGLELRLDAEQHVFLDESQLVQVLVNLLVNAAQALPIGNAEDHRVTVTTQDRGRDVVIRVADTGPGVPEDVRKRIFDPFFTTKPVGSGTGLGLSVCHSIVSQYGGTMELENTADGACFRIVFPAADGIEQPVSERRPTVAFDPESPDEPLGRLLIVDDEDAVAAMLERSLQEQFAITVARSGQQAIELLQDGASFDVLLCDLVMPQVSGAELLRHLIDERPDLCGRLVLMTGGTMSDDTARLVEQRGVDVLQKPIELTRLRELMCERVERVSS